MLELLKQEYRGLSAAELEAMRVDLSAPKVEFSSASVVGGLRAEKAVQAKHETPEA